LTRQSIILRVKCFYAMDPRVKPGGDEQVCGVTDRS